MCPPRPRSYKPSARNFEIAMELANVSKSELLHVAESLYHDIEPANRLGITSVWVNRKPGDTRVGATQVVDAKPDFEVQDLNALASLMGL